MAACGRLEGIKTVGQENPDSVYVERTAEAVACPAFYNPGAADALMKIFGLAREKERKMMRTNDELRTLVAALATCIGEEGPVDEQNALGTFNLFYSGNFAGGLVEREWRLANADRIIAEARRGWVPVELVERGGNPIQVIQDQSGEEFYLCSGCAAHDWDENKLIHTKDCPVPVLLAAIEKAKEGK